MSVPLLRTDEMCVTDDDLHTLNLHFGSFFSAAVDEVKYSIEFRPDEGAWSTVGSTTVQLS